MPDQRTIVITGASDGIGAEAARQLTEQGLRVVIVGRSPHKTAAVARELGAPYHVADFADLAQVKTLADTLLREYPRIDVLANNAGGIFTQETTVDGFDKTFQVNHLAPFYLTTLLLERLVESTASVIQTSSVGARAFGKVDLDDLDNARKWSANKAYGDAKLENILFTKELHRRYHHLGLTAAAFHPGGIATNFAHNTSSVMRVLYRTPLRKLLTGVETGGRALAWFVLGEADRTWLSGQYYEKGRIAEKVNPQSIDADLARGLWERSETLVKQATR